MNEKNYIAVGLMSGTSLDGLDLALCSFKKKEGAWDFDILKGETIEYTSEWKKKLSFVQETNITDFIKLHRDFGTFMGNEVKRFTKGLKHIDLVASHGHTVFHKPSEDITFQIGCGAYLAARCNLTVISDFRTLDIALGGQGAPLVPIGDQLLFSNYDACINLGGFANISYDSDNGTRIAYDISPVNIVTNQLTKRHFNQPFDFNGDIGKNGVLNSQLLEKLNQIDFYHAKGPKSLGREWVETVFNPILDKYKNTNAADVMTTCYHHFAHQISGVINENQLNNVLFTGGGTFNSYLMELIKSRVSSKVNIPDKNIIDYKEALIFAFLGVLRLEETANCLSSVTGASTDNVGGSVYCIKKETE